jgi:hypothetical protein
MNEWRPGDRDVLYALVLLSLLLHALTFWLIR